LPSNPNTVDLGRRPAGYGSLLMLVAVAPLLVSYVPDGKPKNLTRRKTYRVFAKYREASAYMHVISSSSSRIPPTAPSDLTVTNPPRPLVQAVQRYINPKFLTSHTTAPFDSSGGDLIVVCASSHDGVTLTPSDSFSNTWISAAGPTNTSRGFNLRTQVWYAKSPTVGLGHTFTLNLSTAQPLVISVLVVRGSNSSAPIDAISTIGDDGGSQTLKVSSPNITTINGNDLLIGFVKSSVAETFEQGSGFTAQPLASSNFLYAETAPAVTSGPYAARFALDAAATWEAVVMAVRPSTLGVSLSWAASADNVGVASYSVERCEGSGCRDFARIATTTGTSFVDTWLVPMATYRYRVRASDAVGNLSRYSDVARITFPGHLLEGREEVRRRAAHEEKYD
jgi:hypothetical protein